MRTVSKEELTAETFSPFEAFADKLEPVRRVTRKSIEFYRDMLQKNISTDIVSYSICKVWPHELVIGTSEYHNNSAEFGF